MFYSQTCPNTFDIYMDELLNDFTNFNIHGIYGFAWYAAFFFVELAELQIEFNQDDQYLATIKKLVQLKEMKLTNYKHAMKKSMYSRRLFQHSKKCGRSFKFRFELVKMLFENGLYQGSIYENATWCCNRLDINVQLGTLAPTVLLELSLEASSISLDTLNIAYQLCISILTAKRCLTCTEVKKQSTKWLPTMKHSHPTEKSEIHRLFSICLDAHATNFNIYSQKFSIFEYNRQRGLFHY